MPKKGTQSVTTIAEQRGRELMEIPSDDDTGAFRVKMTEIKLESLSVEAVMSDNYQTLLLVTFNDGSASMIWTWGDQFRVFTNVE